MRKRSLHLTPYDHNVGQGEVSVIKYKLRRAVIALRNTSMH